MPASRCFTCFLSDLILLRSFSGLETWARSGLDAKNRPVTGACRTRYCSETGCGEWLAVRQGFEPWRRLCLPNGLWYAPRFFGEYVPREAGSVTIRSPAPNSTKFDQISPNSTIGPSARPFQKTFNLLQFASFPRSFLHFPNNAISTLTAKMSGLRSF